MAYLIATSSLSAQWHHPIKKHHLRTHLTGSDCTAWPEVLLYRRIQPVALPCQATQLPTQPDQRGTESDYTLHLNTEFMQQHCQAREPTQWPHFNTERSQQNPLTSENGQRLLPTRDPDTKPSSSTVITSCPLW